MVLRKIFLFLSFLVFSISSFAQHSLSIQISLANDGVEASTQKGRLFVFLSEQKRPAPRQQLWPSYKNHIYAYNLKSWPKDGTVAFNDLEYFHGTAFGLDKIPEGTYYLQALWAFNQEETHPNAPGNIFSEVQEIEIKDQQSIALKLDQIIPERKLAEHELVKLVELKSDLLTSFWDKPMTVKASVLLPSGFYEKPNAKYPICYNVAGYGGRYTRINRYIERDKKFLEWWTSDEAPQIITVFLDGSGPYGDSYQLDSENSGPYGQVLVEELIPLIEDQYRAIGSSEMRFLDGCSTGGWVSLALQIFYPETFGGTWSYSPDPVHFGQMQLVDLYKDDNAFVNKNGNNRTSMRSTLGEPIFTIQQEIAIENAVGHSNSFATSGEQWGAWNALYSPKDPTTGLPKTVFDPFSGKIDATVVEHWKKYDLLEHVKTNWKSLGPKLAGKIFVWMGDMDQFFLNNALRSMESYLNTTKEPVSDAILEFTPQKGHCSEYSHREVLEKINTKVKQSLAQQKFPLEKDIRTLDGIINAYYEVVSGPAGPRQVERDKSLHHPDAHVMITREDKEGNAVINSMDLNTYHSDFASTAAFYEKEIHRVTETFGHITHVWSTYEYTFEPNGPVMGRGINSIQLYHDGDRWWILGWGYDSERKNNPLPKKYLESKN